MVTTESLPSPRRCLFVAFIALLMVQAAGAGGAVGVRYGWADVDDEFFEGSGELGGTDLAGIQIVFDLLPVISTEIAGEYVSEPFEFDHGLIEGIEAAGRGDYEDLSLFVTGKLNVLSWPFLRGYIGCGVNVHFYDLELEDVVRVTTKGAAEFDDELDAAIKTVAGEQTRPGWHALAGVRLVPSGAPFSIFAEARYSEAFEEEVPELPATKSIYGGASIEF